MKTIDDTFKKCRLAGLRWTEPVVVALHVPVAASSLLRPQPEDPPPRPEAPEPAHQLPGRTQDGRLWSGAH